MKSAIHFLNDFFVQKRYFEGEDDGNKITIPVKIHKNFMKGRKEKWKKQRKQQRKSLYCPLSL